MSFCITLLPQYIEIRHLLLHFFGVLVGADHCDGGINYSYSNFYLACSPLSGDGPHRLSWADHDSSRAGCRGGDRRCDFVHVFWAHICHRDLEGLVLGFDCDCA
jgi:hypothetical protein